MANRLEDEYTGGLGDADGGPRNVPLALSPTALSPRNANTSQEKDRLTGAETGGHELLAHVEWAVGLCRHSSAQLLPLV